MNSLLRGTGRTSYCSIFIEGFRLDALSFWTLETNEKVSEPNEKGEIILCLDSTTWTLEAVRNGKYHVVQRYCPPRAGLREFGLYLVKLTKCKTKESDFR
jgi:hypothetical protein